MIKNRKLTLALVLGAFVFGIIGGLWAQVLLMPYLASHPLFEDMRFVREWNERTTVIRDVQEVVIQSDEAGARVVAQVEDTVVGIESRSSIRTLTGSGFIVTSDGFILTLASIVPQGYNVFVYSKEGEAPLPAQVLRRDTEANLAILKIEQSNLHTASFASQDSSRLGTSLVTLAKSLEGEDLISIVNQGYVRTAEETLLRTNIFDKKALAGAPVFDFQGRVIGLGTFAVDGRLLVIPSSTLRLFSGF